MTQVIYIQYGTVKVKRFEGETEIEDALVFIDTLQNHLFLPGGVVLGVISSEWARSQVGDRPQRIMGRLWLDEPAKVDRRLDAFIEHELEQPCQHCDQWCRGRCKGATSCVQAGKPGHTQCSSRLIDEGLLTRG